MTSTAKPGQRTTSFNPLTERVWVAGLGRLGSATVINPWNTYAGDYSDEDLADFGLHIRQDWLDRDNLYLLPFALGSLAKNCKDERLRPLWQHIQGLVPGDLAVEAEPELEE